MSEPSMEEKKKRPTSRMYFLGDSYPKKVFDETAHKISKRVRKNLAINLLLSRNLLGWTISDLAEASCVSFKTIDDIENCKVNFQIDTITKLALALGIHEFILFLGYEEIKAIISISEIGDHESPTNKDLILANDGNKSSYKIILKNSKEELLHSKSKIEYKGSGNDIMMDEIIKDHAVLLYSMIKIHNKSLQKDLSNEFSESLIKQRFNDFERVTI